MFADISFPISSYQVFTYKVPDELINRLSIGMRVNVPLGSRIIKGIIVDLKKTTNFSGSIKSIIEIYSIYQKTMLSYQVLVLI